MLSNLLFITKETDVPPFLNYDDVSIFLKPQRFTTHDRCCPHLFLMIYIYNDCIINSWSTDHSYSYNVENTKPNNNHKVIKLAIITVVVMEKN